MVRCTTKLTGPTNLCLVFMLHSSCVCVDGVFFKTGTWCACRAAMKQSLSAEDVMSRRPSSDVLSASNTVVYVAYAALIPCVDVWRV
jgi:hypothetical protein